MTQLPSERGLRKLNKTPLLAAALDLLNQVRKSENALSARKNRCTSLTAELNFLKSRTLWQRLLDVQAPASVTGLPTHQ